jgi:putative ABC transport system ATP-binding protein
MSAPLLAVESLRYVRGRQTILHDVSVTVGEGERVAVVGPSGSGKTSLLTLLAGLVRPDGGQVLLDGVPIEQTDPGTRQVAIVLQGYGLISLLTSAENVEIAVRAAGRTAKDARESAARVLDELGLTPYADNLVEELSGGQQQRVAVARALALRPRVLLADEPTAEQDPGHRAIVMDRLMHAEGSTVVLATHDLQIAAGCDRMIEVRDGRLAGAGQAGAVASAP